MNTNQAWLPQVMIDGWLAGQPAQNEGGVQKPFRISNASMADDSIEYIVMPVELPKHIADNPNLWHRLDISIRPRVLTIATRNVHFEGRDFEFAAFWGFPAEPYNLLRIVVGYYRAAPWDNWGIKIDTLSQKDE